MLSLLTWKSGTCRRLNEVHCVVKTTAENQTDLTSFARVTAEKNCSKNSFYGNTCKKFISYSVKHVCI